MEVSTLCVGCLRDIDLPGPGTPICVVPGFGGCPRIYRLLLQQLHDGADPKRRVICIRPLRHYRPYGSPLRLPRPIGMQAAHVLQVTADMGVDKMIVLGHSFGASVGTAMGILSPARVKRIIGVCPSGVSPDNWLSLLRRANRLWQAEMRHIAQLPDIAIRPAKAVQEALRNNIKANPLLLTDQWQAAQEFSTLAAVQQHGLDAYFVGGSYDILYPVKPLIATVKAQLGPERIIQSSISHLFTYKPDEVRTLEKALCNKKRDLLTL